MEDRHRAPRTHVAKIALVSVALVLSLWMASRCGPFQIFRLLTLRRRAGGEAGGGQCYGPRDLNPDICEAALTAGRAVSQPTLDTWRNATAQGRGLGRLGRRAEALERRALAAFDAVVVQQDVCRKRRDEMVASFREDCLALCSVQRRLAEDASRRALASRLLRAMRRRKGPLRAQEKVSALQVAVSDYRQKVRELTPTWAVPLHSSDDELAVEHNLGEVEFGIEDSPDGRTVQHQNKQHWQQQLLSKRAHGISAFWEPGLRVLVRPDGIGNLQFFASGPLLAPSGSRINIHFGVVNDGSMSAVYREHPVVPEVVAQPALHVDLNIG
mmetsp:Transcript_86582/g.278008  ORF Transcript_86582/g.278008 Transcript_86582/m.278008 type:complete len:327 (+) Transcript_86582:58-1038(+)